MIKMNKRTIESNAPLFFSRAAQTRATGNSRFEGDKFPVKPCVTTPAAPPQVAGPPRAFLKFRPILVDRRPPADNLTARRRCHCCSIVILLQLSMKKRKPSGNLEDSTKFFRES